MLSLLTKEIFATKITHMYINKLFNREVDVLWKSE